MPLDNSNQDFNTLLNAVGIDPGTLFRPVRPLANPLNETSIGTLSNRLQGIQSVVKSTSSTGTKASGSSSGTPKQLITVSATESPSKQQDRTFSEVSVTFTRDASDPAFAGVHIWFKNYKGNTNWQLMTDGSDSPVNFLCETTGETVIVKVQPFGSDGTPATFTAAKTCTVTLNGVVSAPPGPSIAQSLAATPLGYQFTFTQVTLSAGTQDVVDSYKVYRNTSNTTSGASIFKTYKHDPTNTGANVIVQDTTPNGVVYYYWVSAINTVGLESTKTAAQSGTVASATPITGVGPQAVLSPTTVTTPVDWAATGATISSLPQGATVPTQGSFQWDVYSTGGLVDVILASAGGTTGYVFRFEGRSGQSPIIFKVNGTGANQYTILSTGPVNSSTQTGWHHVDVRVAGQQYDLYIDGAWVCSAIDTSYTPSGHLYYCYLIVAGMVIAPSAMIHKTSDNIPNGSTSWVPNANTAFAQGTQIVDSVTTIPTSFTSPQTGNSTTTPTGCLSCQIYLNTGKAVGVGITGPGGDTAYSFVINGANGQHLAYLQKLSSITGAVGGNIGTIYSPVNSGNKVGWYDCHFFFSDTGLMNLYVNGLLAASALDTTYTPTGVVKYWGGDATSGKIGPAPAQKVGSTFLNGQGNLSTGTINSFTYTSTTTTIKWTWTAFTLYAADGSTVSVAANSTGTTFSGLTASTTYKFGFYINVATGVCTAVKSDVTSGTGSFSAQLIQQTLNGDGNSSINYNVAAATTASGSGGGSGGGGTGGCFSPNTKLACGTQMSEVTPGQHVWVEKDNGDRVLRPVRRVLIHDEYKSLMCDMGDGQLVTPEHPMKSGGSWQDADTAFSTSTKMWVGTVYDLEIDTEVEDERNFVLANGQVAHNKIF